MTDFEIDEYKKILINRIQSCNRNNLAQTETLLAISEAIKLLISLEKMKKDE